MREETISLKKGSLQDIETPFGVFKPKLQTDNITVDLSIYSWNNEVFGRYKLILFYCVFRTSRASVFLLQTLLIHFLKPINHIL